MMKKEKVLERESWTIRRKKKWEREILKLIHEQTYRIAA